MDNIKNKLSEICGLFRVPGELLVYRELTSGNINTTYYAALYDGKEVRQYLVQRVNWYVFKDPISMMRNIDLITSYIMDGEENMERRRRLHFHRTAEGKNYVVMGEGEDKEFWRLSNFVENSVSFDTPDGDPNVLRMAGKAFGHFEVQLRDFDASQLVESIPHFHDTRLRLNKFFDDVEADPCGRVAECATEIELIQNYREFGSQLSVASENGTLPLRVTHNDTKTNNVLFDARTMDPLVVIDLDTCMPGLACCDFGDAVRFAACTAAEDEPDTSKIRLDLQMYRAFAEGFIGETASFLTPAELDSMAIGAAVITLELASRFLDDYLTGDKYFKTLYPGHNLVRARAQLALFKDMINHLDEMKSIICEIAGK